MAAAGILRALLGIANEYFFFAIYRKNNWLADDDVAIMKNQTFFSSCHHGTHFFPQIKQVETMILLLILSKMYECHAYLQLVRWCQNGALAFCVERGDALFVMLAHYIITEVWRILLFKVDILNFVINKICLWLQVCRS